MGQPAFTLRGDRVAAMYLGRIAETGTTASVFGNPVHPYTEALLSAVPLPGVGLLPVKMVERYVADGTMQIATSLPVVENDRLFIGPRKGVEDSKAAAVEKTINRVLDGLDCLAR